MKPDPEAVALLRQFLALLENGQVRDVFVLARCADGEYAYDFVSYDVPDLLYELGTVILTEREPRR